MKGFKQIFVALVASVACFVIYLLQYRWHFETYPVRTSYGGVTVNESVPVLRPGVVIVTNYRSGSSFFGELFNQHPEVYYSFEPLISVDVTNPALIQQELLSILKCEIRDVSENMPDGTKTDPTFTRCKKHNVCFRTKMKDLCSPNFCRLSRICQQCRRLKTTEMSSLCNSKRMSVIKVIRLQKLATLEPIMKEIDLKVIHLVRDPRGIASSRIKLKFQSKIKSTCRKMNENLNMGLVETPAWLNGRYLLVRYEDVAMNPIEMAEDIYEFVGLTMTDDIMRWIEVNTKGAVRFTNNPTAQRLQAMRKKRRRKLPSQKIEQMVLRNPYTTVRKSNATWQAWRHHLSSNDIQEVQNQCKGAMKTLGYIPLPENSIDDENFRVMGTLPYFGLIPTTDET